MLSDSHQYHLNSKNYQIIGDSFFQKGGFGQVYQAINILTGKKIAIKQIAKEQKNLKQQRNLKRQKQILQKVKHENMVKFIKIEQNNTHVQIFMQYCDIDLRKIIWLQIKNKKIFTEEQCIFIMMNIFEVLNYLFKNHKLLHRDLKPANILVDKGLPKLSDFGISKIDFNSELSQTSGINSSIKYTALQIFKGQSRYTQKCDVYGFGCILYELLHLQYAFKNFLNEKVIIKRKIINENLRGLLQKCLQRQQKNRYTWKNIEEHPIYLYYKKNIQPNKQKILKQIKLMYEFNKKNEMFLKQLQKSNEQSISTSKIKNQQTVQAQKSQKNYNAELETILQNLKRPEQKINLQFKKQKFFDNQSKVQVQKTTLKTKYPGELPNYLMNIKIFQQKTVSRNYESRIFINEYQSQFQNPQQQINPPKLERIFLESKKQKSLLQQLQSSIIKNQQQLIILLKFFGKRKVNKLSLLYKASVNNFSIKKYFQICGNKKDTIIICETTQNKQSKIFGGYTPLQFSNQSSQSIINQFVPDNTKNSFIFSLTNNDKFQLQNINTAIYRFIVENSIQFGWGQLRICDNAGSNYNSYSYITNSTYKNQKYKHNQQSYLKLNGNKNQKFKAKQWEVFQVQFQ